MYEFLYSEVWWMETIIAAVISAVTALLIAWLGYKGKIKDILDSLSQRKDEHLHLSEGQARLSEGQARLSEGQNRIINNQNSLMNAEASIKDGIIRTENNVNKILEDTLRRQGKDIAVQDAINHTVDLQNLLLSQEKYIYELKTECLELKTENDKLKERNRQLRIRINDYNESKDIGQQHRKDDYEL